MPRTIKSHSTTQLIETTTRLDLVELEDNLFVFQRQVSSEVSERTNGKQTKTGLRANPAEAPKGRQSGFVNLAGRKQLMAGKPVSKKNELKLMWLTPEQIEAFRFHGYSAVQDTLWALWGNRETDAWTDWELNPERSLDELVNLDYSSHLMYDRNGRPLPVALMFDYISGRVDNRNYDLADAYAHLAARDDVRLFRGDEPMRKSMPEKPEPTSLDEALFMIPYYNADAGRTQALQFMWVPDADDYARAFSKNMAGRRHETVLHHDILGLRALRKDKDPYE